MSIRFIRVIFMCCIGCLFCCDAHCVDWISIANSSYISVGGTKEVQEKQKLEKNQMSVYKLGLPVDTTLISKNYKKEESKLIINSLKKQVENKILFSTACEDGKPGKCDVFFKDTNVIQADAKKLVGYYLGTDKFDCDTKIRKTYSLGIPKDDYLACTRYDKTPYQMYEFLFDDLFESSGITIENSIRTKLCKIAGGEISLLGFQCYFGDKDSTETKPNPIIQHKCEGLKNMAAGLNHDVEYKKYRAEISLETHGTKIEKNYEDRYGCFFKSNHITIFELDRNYFDINEKKFFNYQISAPVDMDVLMCRYIKNMMLRDKQLKMNSCEYYGHRSLEDNNGGVDDVVFFNVTDENEKKYQIHFIMDDIAELFKTQRNSGYVGLSCLSSGGKYRGEDGVCFGVGQDFCDKLNIDLKNNGDKNGARWDDELEMCHVPVMENNERLMNAYHYTKLGMDVVQNAATAVVSGVTGQWYITLPTLAVIAGLVVVEFAQHNINERAGKIIEEAQKCIKCKNRNEDGFCVDFKEDICAANLFTKFVKEGAFEEYDSWDVTLQDYIAQLVEELIYSFPTSGDEYAEWHEDVAFMDLRYAIQSAEMKNSTAEQVIAFTNLAVVIASLFAAKKSSSAVSNTGVIEKMLIKNSKSAEKLLKVAKTITNSKIAANVINAKEASDTIDDVNDTIDAYKTYKNNLNN